jgi:hypothetical protein
MLRWEVAQLLLATHYRRSVTPKRRRHQRDGPTFQQIRVLGHPGDDVLDELQVFVPDFCRKVFGRSPLRDCQPLRVELSYLYGLFDPVSQVSIYVVLACLVLEQKPCQDCHVDAPSLYCLSGTCSHVIR